MSVSPGVIAANGVIGGTSYFSYMDMDYMGAGTGSILGSYGGGSWSFRDSGINFVRAPLTFFSEVEVGSPYYFDGSSLISEGSLSGFFGGTVSPWSSSSSVSAALVGVYSRDGSTRSHVWSDSLASSNYRDTVNPNTTYDGAAYTGYFSGSRVWNSSSQLDALTARIVGFYIDANSNGGFLLGSLSGTGYPLSMSGADGMFAMTGSLQAVALFNDTSFTPNQLGSQDSSVIQAANFGAVDPVSSSGAFYYQGNSFNGLTNVVTRMESSI